MSNAGVECDAVTCCSLITALDKGGQWQLAEQVCRPEICRAGRTQGATAWQPSVAANSNGMKSQVAQAAERPP